MEDMTTLPGEDFPVAYPGTALSLLLLDLPLAGDELGALGGHGCATAAALLEL